MNLNFSSMPRFRPDVNRLLVVSGLLSISFFGIQALLKIFYVLRLGYGPEILGIFNGAGALTYMAMSLPAGFLGERIGLLPAMRLGGVLTVLGLAALPLTESLPTGLWTVWPIFSQILLTSGWALFGINMVPALTAATTDQNRNSAYALNGTLRGLGTLSGTIAGGILPGIFAGVLGETLDQTGPYRLGLWISTLLGLGALIFLLRIRPLEQTESAQGPQIRTPFPVLPVGLLVAHVYLVNAGWATCQSFCNAYMDTDLGLSPAVIGLITGIGQLAAVFAPLIAPRLASRQGNGWTLMMTAAITVPIMLSLSTVPHWSGAGIGRSGVLAVTALWMPALQVYQMEMVERHWRSLAYGVVSMAMGFSFGSISLLGGYFAARWGYQNLFQLGVVLAIGGALVMWRVQRLSVPSVPQKMRS